MFRQKYLEKKKEEGVTSADEKRQNINVIVPLFECQAFKGAVVDISDDA